MIFDNKILADLAMLVGKVRNYKAAISLKSCHVYSPTFPISSLSNTKSMKEVWFEWVVLGGGGSWHIYSLSNHHDQGVFFSSLQPLFVHFRFQDMRNV